MIRWHFNIDFAPTMRMICVVCFAVHVRELSAIHEWSASAVDYNISVYAPPPPPAPNNFCEPLLWTKCREG